MTKDEEWLLQEKFNGEKSKAFFADCKRLHQGEPLAYVIGTIPFLGCTIHLDSKPLIPRPETEFWTERAIFKIAQMQSNTPTKPLRVLDLCAGSGCIGVAVAKHVTMVRVDFAEIVADHLPTISKNIALNGVASERCNLIKSNLFSNIIDRYDIILSNPPYIDQKMNRTEISVTAYEPHTALFGGENGSLYLSAIISNVTPHLSPTGQLWLEHEPEQISTLSTTAKIYGLSLSTHNDQYNTPRFSILMLE